MVNHLISEVALCLKNELYMSALITALTLPDICGKAEFPSYGPTKRYKEWLIKYANLQCDNLIKADEIHQLRNSMIHQGTPSLDSKMTEFELIIQSKDKASKIMQAVYDTGESRVLSVNVESLCEILCSAAYNYYSTNKDKFNFLNYRIVNTDYRTAKLFKLSEQARNVNLNSNMPQIKKS